MTKPHPASANAPARTLPAHPDSAPTAPHWDLRAIVAGLHEARAQWRSTQHRSSAFGVREFPSPDALRQIADALCGVLFPMRLGPPDLNLEGEDFYVGHTLEVALNALQQQVRLELAYQARHSEGDADFDYQSVDIVRNFACALPALRALLDEDVQAAYDGDPAARSVDEVLLCYPGVLAIIHHRLAHALYRLGVPLIARIIAEISHSRTGIDIHPGADIGPGFFIDHGTGVVIGETTVIGRRVRLYQAVTLGARRFDSDAEGHLARGGARHPIVEDDVVIYAGATVLGRITIGRGSSIGGNVWLTRSVPPHSQVTQAGLQHGSTREPAAT